MSFHSDFSEDASSLVSGFYDRFPYPDQPIVDGPPPGFNWRWSYEMAFAACSGALPILKKNSNSNKIRILDAGCGTGVSTDYLVHQNPGTEILAVDISKVALEIAVERIERSGGNSHADIRFEHLSLFDINEYEGFDFINSVGVLHHLDDPEAGLKKLESLLKPGGIIHLFLYAEAGRSKIKSCQRALNLIGIRNENKGLQMARKLLADLPEKNPIKCDYEGRWMSECSSDIVFADMFFHPVEIAFNLDRLIKLIDTTNLDFAGFSNPSNWQLDRFLKDNILEKAMKLSTLEQLKLIEYLDPGISHFELFLSKGLNKKLEWSDDDYLLRAKGKINPFLYGWPGQTLYDSDMRRIDLSVDQFVLLEALEKDSNRPLGCLLYGWNKTRMASTARDLLQKQVLLLYPLSVPSA